jgi:hypothetical protein
MVASKPASEIMGVIALNRNVLRVYWNDQIDAKTALNRLQHI